MVKEMNNSIPQSMVVVHMPHEGFVVEDVEGLMNILAEKVDDTTTYKLSKEHGFSTRTVHRLRKPNCGSYRPRVDSLIEILDALGIQMILVPKVKVKT